MVMCSHKSYITLWLKTGNINKRMPFFFLRGAFCLHNTHRLGQTGKADLYTSMNSCRNLKTIVNQVFQAKTPKGEKKITLDIIFFPLLLPAAF